MNEDEKKFAEIVLKRLCKGTQVDGIRFGPTLQILLSPCAIAPDSIKGQVYLNLSDRWTVFETRPDNFPKNENDLLEVSTEDEIQRIVALRERVIINVELGTSEPHLILTLNDGRVLFVNGKHGLYESWDMGVAYGSEKELWQVIACPGGGIAIWTPSTFDNTST